MPHFPKPFFRKSRNLWYVQIDGKRINLGTNREDAFRRYHQLMGKPKKSRSVPSDSLASIIDTFLEWVQRRRSPATYEWYRFRLQRFIRKSPDLRAGDLRPFHVETWADGYDQSVTSRRNDLRSVKRCLKWAKKQGYIDRNPIADMEVPSAESKEVYVPPDEFSAFLGWARNRNLADLLEVTYDCGCRPQELLRVTAKEVDLPHQRWVFQRSNSKGMKLARVVYLPEKSLAITKRLVDQYDDGGVLFRNANGRPWTPDAVNCALDAVQVRMGKAVMQRRGETISDDEVVALIPTLRPTKTVKGMTVVKSETDLRCDGSL